MKKKKIILLLLVAALAWSCSKTEPPKPVGPLPAPQQLAWHELEYYGFLHFNMNTFTNIEWGTGAESPDMFNPSELDAEQWAKVAKEAGMKALIITAKHHDGFCLWPSEYTEHSVKNSTWKNGKGDVLRELSEACKKYGLKFGVYLSPWDRNHPDYGTPEYVEVFHNQLRELLTNYGEVFEVWFDGANGGSGYYGGANETRKIENRTYYQWDKVEKLVNKLQPNAVIFGDGGPGVRWVGNEEGWANETNWSLLRKKEVYPGYPKYKELRSGHEDGTHWVPAEADVSIRPGWYYHPYEDHKVKTLPHLLDIYYQSVGRNASLLLNLPIDNRGLVHENDQMQLRKLATQLEKDFAENILGEAQVSATNVRGGSSSYAASQVNDSNSQTYWATNDSVVTATISFSFDKPMTFNRLLLQEYIALGQRVKAFDVEVETDGRWEKVDQQTTIGYKRILRLKTVTSSKLRINITDAKGAIALSNVELFNAPKVVVDPSFKRKKSGEVSLTVPDSKVEVYYTLDGSIPDETSFKYSVPFLVDQPATVKAISYDPSEKVKTGVASKTFDIAKKEWKVLKTSSSDYTTAEQLIDEDPGSWWSTGSDKEGGQEVIIDLGDTFELKGFTYLPMQDRWIKGVITHFEFFVSEDNKRWKKVAGGEFGNIWNNPIEQKIDFELSSARYIKLVASKVHGENAEAAFAEIGVITR